MFLPPDLQAPHYSAIPVLAKLNEISFLHKDDHTQPIYPWAGIRDILENLAMLRPLMKMKLSSPTNCISKFHA